jgi:two-component system phosphate regulon response regulator OmpR
MRDFAATSLPGAHVLVVDDEERVRSMLVRALTLLGYLTEGAASGYEALAALERDVYDVMVVDIRMPGMDGVELMRRARQMYPDLSIIVLTGHGTLDSAIAAIRSSAADYLFKPASIHDVATAVFDALQKRWGALVTPTLKHVRRAGPVILDQDRCLVMVVKGDDLGGLNIQLTPSETTLLAHLMQHPGTVVSCQELACALGYDLDEKEAQTIVWPHISHLRRKLNPDPEFPSLIHTVSGQGYSFLR